MRRWIVPGIPFVVSLTLSAFTVGAHVGWQDSGFFLAGIRDLGVLYPPGFALHLLLAKAWTLVFGFLDFTLAVHLYSAFCAALAAGTLSVAARDLIRSRGPLGLAGTDSDPAAIAAGCLAAAGFSFWSSGLLAKGYAFYFLILALLLWRLIRADESGQRRDFVLAAALIGLAWAAHPSAVVLGPVLILYIVLHRKTIGGKGIVIGVATAAACALAPSLLLPAFASRHPAVMFGDPSSFDEWLRYLTGERFTGRSGVFGVDGWRVGAAFRDFWEEFLGVGLLALGAGLVRVGTANRKLLYGLLVWTLPAALLAVLFRIEGQMDFWLVAAWLPLHLAVAVGLAQIPGRWVAPAAAAAGLLWAVLASGPAVSQRNHTLAEQYGRFHLENLERDAIVFFDSDDALATAQYLQVVESLRTDVVVVSAPRFSGAWYPGHLKRRHPGLRAGTTAMEFAAANAATSPVYFEQPPQELPPADLEYVPAGPLLRLAPRGKVEPQEWKFPVSVEGLRDRLGRPRGIRLQVLADRLVVEPEPYEQRWISAFVRAKVQTGQAAFKKGGDENLREAIEAFEAARSVDPGRPDRDLVHTLGASYYLIKNYEKAEPLLKQLLDLKPPARQAVRACSFLSNICKAQGRTQEALQYQQQGMGIVGADPELRREYERFPRQQ